MTKFENSENLEVFHIEWEDEYHVFLLDPTKGSPGASRIIDSCTLKK